MGHTVTGMLFGTFDGVHMGHVALVEQALQKLEGRNEKVVGMPQKQRKTTLYIVVGRGKTVAGVKGRGPKQSERERMAALRALFPEAKVVLGHKTNRMHWLRTVRPDVVFLGYDQVAFVDILKAEIKKMNSAHVRIEERRVPTRIVRLKPFNEGVYKSSKIKKPHVLVRGTVVHGKKLARSVGYPTANIALSSGAKMHVSARVAPGIYASRAILSHSGRMQIFLAATVVGARTHGGAPLVETHLIGYKGDCYGATLTISLEKKLRNFKVYTSREALKRDIEKDVSGVNRFFGFITRS